jgi:hypothetical protein
MVSLLNEFEGGRSEVVGQGGEDVDTGLPYAKLFEPVINEI